MNLSHPHERTPIGSLTRLNRPMLSPSHLLLALLATAIWGFNYVVIKLGWARRTNPLMYELLTHI